MPNEVGTAYVNIKPDLTGFGRSLDVGLTRSTSPLAGRFSGIGRVAGLALATGVGAGIAGVGLALKKTVDLAAEFDKSMRTISAVAEVSGNSLDRLRGLALKMGQQTVFSANESATAMLELTKAGVSTSDIMGGALKQALALATAGELDLASAAGYMANALNIFNLKGKDAQQAADALAGAANASSADVSDLGLALAQTGQAASNADLSIQETTAALALFGNEGIKGSDAGTSLKTSLQRLVPRTDEAKDAMRELGFDAFEANGNFKSLRDIAQSLQDSLKNLTPEARSAALQIMFGADASRAASILATAGAKGIDKMTEATSKVGTAAEVGKKRMGGFSGAMESLKGSLETIGIQIGTVLLPVLTDLAKQFVALLKRKDVKQLIDDITAAFKFLAPWIAKVAFLMVSQFIDKLKMLVAAWDFVKRNIGGVLAFLTRGFRMFLVFFFGVANGILAAAEKAFGWIPKIGDRIRAFRADFNETTDNIIAGVDRAAASMERWGDKSSGNINRVLSDWQLMKRGVEAGLSPQLIRAQGAGLPIPGGAGGSAARMAQTVMAAVPGPQYISSGYRPGDDGYHGDARNPAQDISGAQSGGVFLAGDAIFRAAIGTFGASIREAIWGHTRWEGGRANYWAPNDHWDHVHLADKGGVFKGPGMVGIGPIKETVFQPAEKVGDLPAGSTMVNHFHQVKIAPGDIIRDLDWLAKTRAW